MKLRLSATDLEQVRYYRESEEMDLPDLLRRLRKEEPPTDAMAAGTAFHAILETPPSDVLGEVEHSGYRFRFDVDASFDLLPIRELKGVLPLRVAGVDIELVCVVDAMRGLRIDDHKLSAQFDAERYLDSLQWRTNLLVFDARHFRYNVFEAHEAEDDRGPLRVIRAFHPLDFYAYPAMRADVLHAVEDFIALARQHLPERLIPTQEAA